MGLYFEGRCLSFCHSPSNCSVLLWFYCFSWQSGFLHVIFLRICHLLSPSLQCHSCTFSLYRQDWPKYGTQWHFLKLNCYWKINTLSSLVFLIHCPWLVSFSSKLIWAFYQNKSSPLPLLKTVHPSQPVKQEKHFCDFRLYTKLCKEDLQTCPIIFTS